VILVGRTKHRNLCTWALHRGDDNRVETRFIEATSHLKWFFVCPELHRCSIRECWDQLAARVRAAGYDNATDGFANELGQAVIDANRQIKPIRLPDAHFCAPV